MLSTATELYAFRYLSASTLCDAQFGIGHGATTCDIYGSQRPLTKTADGMLRRTLFESSYWALQLLASLVILPIPALTRNDSAPDVKLKAGESVKCRSAY
eukprot:560322-Rhodomonas_salina.5